VKYGSKKKKAVYYNVTLRCVRVTIFRWKSIKCCVLWVCVSSCSYPACKRHAPYCHLWPARPYGIFPHYLI